MCASVTEVVTCTAELQRLLQVQWSEAEAADSKYQELLRDVRATSAVFDLELQTFRRTLGNVAGRSDKDFQKLRTERASHRRGRPRSACPACTCNTGR